MAGGLTSVIALVLVVGLALGTFVLMRLLRGAGGSITDQVAAARERYGKPAETLAVADVALGGRAALEAVSRGPAEQLTLWLEHAIEKKGGIMTSGDWQLDVVLHVGVALGAPAEERVEVEYDGEDVRVTPSQYGTTGMPSDWPGSSQKTRIATLPMAPAGARVRVEASIASRVELASARMQLAIMAGPAPKV